MNLLKYISSNNYLNSPITILHTIENYKKVIFTFTILFILPYIYLNNLKIIFFLLIILLVNSYKKIFNLINVYYIILKGFIYIIYIILFTYFIDYKYQVNQKISISLIYFPYSIILFILKYKISVLYIIYYIPRYIEKLIILNVSQIILIKTMFTFTKYEIVTNIILDIYIKIRHLKFYKYYKNLLNILISYHLLEKIFRNINKIYITVKIKNNKYTKNTLYHSNYFIYKYIINLLEDQNYISLILWTRYINNKI
uniref:Uncharacterized protein n=1 Tax=Thaumatella adunca TaxID=2006976 RepID=A0A1Z1MMW7_9FLOR|nr:hypothetical protein [Thaumatella adunca]ARW67427.1 hypothetical protein [Thaumatella adunca]